MNNHKCSSFFFITITNPLYFFLFPCSGCVRWLEIYMPGTFANGKSWGSVLGEDFCEKIF